MFALSRQPVPLLDGSDRSKVQLGAYPIFSNHSPDYDPDLILISSGSEVARTVEVAKRLPMTLRVRFVSMPSQSHFDRQPAVYRRSVLGTGKALAVAIEAWSSYGWARYVHASFSMHTFGLSAPQAKLFDIFGFSVDNITEKLVSYVDGKRVEGKIVLPPVGEFEELLLGFAQIAHSH